MCVSLLWGWGTAGTHHRPPHTLPGDASAHWSLRAPGWSSLNQLSFIPHWSRKQCGSQKPPSPLSSGHRIPSPGPSLQAQSAAAHVRHQGRAGEGKGPQGANNQTGPLSAKSSSPWHCTSQCPHGWPAG